MLTEIEFYVESSGSADEPLFATENDKEMCAFALAARSMQFFPSYQLCTLLNRYPSPINKLLTGSSHKFIVWGYKSNPGEIEGIVPLDHILRKD